MPKYIKSQKKNTNQRNEHQKNPQQNPRNHKTIHKITQITPQNPQNIKNKGRKVLNCRSTREDLSRTEELRRHISLRSHSRRILLAATVKGGGVLRISLRAVLSRRKRISSARAKKEGREGRRKRDGEREGRRRKRVTEEREENGESWRSGEEILGVEFRRATLAAAVAAANQRREE